MADRTAPRFSIVIPAYNAAATLAETLDAVRAQQLADWECVVVDDGSADGTLEIARGYKARDPRFLVLHQANAGTAGAYNTAVAAASGEWIVICSADDVLLPEHLKTFSTFIAQNPGYDIYSSNGYVWHPGESRDPVYYDRRSTEAHSKSLADVIRLCFYGVGAVFRRELFEKVSGFRPVFGEDYDFWLRSMAVGARHRYLPQPLSLFRMSATQKSANAEVMYRSDIRLVSELRERHELSDEELQAVDDQIVERERLIARLHGGVLHAIRKRIGPLAVRLVGRPRARRAWHVMKSLARVGARR